MKSLFKNLHSKLLTPQIIVKKEQLIFSGKNNAYFKNLLNEFEANDRILNLLESNNAVMVSRLGGTELKVLNNYITRNVTKNCDWQSELVEELNVNSGVFPINDNILNNFCEVFLESIRKVDIMGVWKNVGENFLLKTLAPNADLCLLTHLEPFFSQKPWSRALKGKNVLVIHPFSKSIESQFLIKDKLFENIKILPDFNLITQEAVQSRRGQNNKFKDWFEALDFMLYNVSKTNFDIAIIGAGAYGLPLASKIKEMGKKAIHLGGATQLLFGIRGRRWDNMEFYKNIFNKHWTYPSEIETPPNCESVEGIGPYWK